MAHSSLFKYAAPPGDGADAFATAAPGARAGPVTFMGSENHSGFHLQLTAGPFALCPGGKREVCAEHSENAEGSAAELDAWSTTKIIKMTTKPRCPSGSSAAVSRNAEAIETACLSQQRARESGAGAVCDGSTPQAVSSAAASPQRCSVSFGVSKPSLVRLQARDSG